jgi:sirohydrochlorin ferrochelatase
VSPKTGIAIFAHGSAIESANQAVRKVASQFAAAGPFDVVEACFLELGQPDLAGAMSRLIERGARRIIVVPYFLTVGTHLQRDLPRIVGEISGIYENVEIIVAPPLDGHPALLTILLDRVRETIER